MKLLESHKSKTTKDENVKNISHLEATEVTLVHCILSRMIINKT